MCLLSEFSFQSLNFDSVRVNIAFLFFTNRLQTRSCDEKHLRTTDLLLVLTNKQKGEIMKRKINVKPARPAFCVRVEVQGTSSSCICPACPWWGSGGGGYPWHSFFTFFNHTLF